MINNNNDNDSHHDKIQVTWELDVEKIIRQEIKKRNNNKTQQSTLVVKSISISIQQPPYMVGIVGIPGSGKTTGAQILMNQLSLDTKNQKNYNNNNNDTDTDTDTDTDNAKIGTIVLPFDGYHIPLNQLGNDNDLIYRRGAPDTFDLDRFINDLSQIRYGRTTNTTNSIGTTKSDTDTDTDTVPMLPIVTLPSFSHSHGDPEYDTIIFNRTQHAVVICEGLYLLHSNNGWDKIKSFFDVCIFIDANIDICMDRLKIRNLNIPGYTSEEIIQRVDNVDRINALYVEKSRSRADLIVQSVASSTSSSALSSS
jgi:pantothenate kinase